MGEGDAVLKYLDGAQREADELALQQNSAIAKKYADAKTNEIQMVVLRALLDDSRRREEAARAEVLKLTVAATMHASEHVRRESERHSNEVASIGNDSFCMLYSRDHDDPVAP